MTYSPIPTSAPFQVDTGRFAIQAYQEVAPTLNGGFLAVWEVSDGSYIPGTWDRDVASIWGRFMDADGNPLGDDFRVNTNLQYSQSNPSVTQLADGGHLVVFSSIAQVYGNGPIENLVVRHFDADGVALGNESLLFQIPGVRTTNPDITRLADGSLVVIWQQGDGAALRGMKLDANGVPSGVSFAIADATYHAFMGLYESPQVKPLTGGGFVAVWGEQTANGVDTFVRQFDADGTAVTERQQVNATLPNDQWFPDVVAMADGGYVVAWGSNGQDSAGYNIYAQRFDASGVKVGGETRLNEALVRESFHVSMCALPDGGYVAVWTRGWIGLDYHFDVLMRRFDADGNPVGDEMLVHPATGVFRAQAVVTLLASGEVLVTWRESSHLVSRTFDVHQIGASGNDSLTGNDNANTIVGQAGHDTLTGMGGHDTLEGGAGDDLIRGGTGNDRIDGGGDNDVLAGNAGNDTAFGGDGDDQLHGGTGRDQLWGDGGNDSLFGGADADLMRGGTGNDLMQGDAGNDTLSGNDGHDTLSGGDGDDVLHGGTGDDQLSGDAGQDTLYGGGGNDLVTGGDGDDRIWGEAGNDTLSGGEGADLVRGGTGNDLLQGDAGNDTLAGNEGLDTLLGGAGNDALIGGAGNDRLDGEGGQDILTGGDGADVFVWANASDSPWNARDTITDFTPGVDRIDLGAIHPDLTWVAAFTGVAGQVYYASTTGRLWVDMNGSGSANFGIELTGAPLIDVGDLIL